MQLNHQLSKRRQQHGWSQEQLAAKMYVSRQTISNWETGRTYPDVTNLLLLSELFDCTLDELVKGDLQEMDKLINRQHLKLWGYVMTVGVLLVPLGLAPAYKYLGMRWGLAVYLLLCATLIIVSIHVDNIKKRAGVETYNDIKRVLNGEPPRHERQSNWVPYLQIFGAIVWTIALLFLSFWFFFKVLP